MLSYSGGRLSKTGKITQFICSKEDFNAEDGPRTWRDPVKDDTRGLVSQSTNVSSTIRL